MSEPETSEAPPPTGDGAPAGKKKRKRKPRTWRQRLRRYLIISGILFGLFVAFLAFALTWANSRYNGKKLAVAVTGLLSEKFKGTFAAERIDWSVSSVWSLLRGRSIPIEIRNASIKDPEGREIIRARQVNAMIDPTEVFKGGLRAHDIIVRDAFCLVADLKHTGLPSEREIGISKTFDSAKPSTGSSEPTDLRLTLDTIQVHNTEFRLEVADTKITINSVNVPEGRLTIRGDPSRGGLMIKAVAGFDKGTWNQNGVTVPLRNGRITRHLINGDQLTGQLLMRAADAAVDGTVQIEHLFDQRTSVLIRAKIAGGKEYLSELIGLPVQGSPQGDFQMKGPIGDLTMSLKARGAATTVQDIPLTGIGGHVDWHVNEGRIRASRLTASALTGHISGTAQYDITPQRWSADLNVDGLNLARFEPQLAGTTGGSVSLSGEVGSPSGLAVVDVTIDRERRRGRDWLPRKLRAKGSLHLGPEILDLAGLTVSGEGNQIRTRGSINTKLKRVNIYMDLNLGGLGGYLARRIRSQPVKKATGRLHIYGTFPRLGSSGTVSLERVGIGGAALPKVRASVTLKGGVLNAQHLTMRAFGGELSGSAKVSLFRGGNITRPYADPPLQASLRARRVDLAKLALPIAAEGRGDASVILRGSLQSPQGEATVKVPRLKLLKESFKNVTARVGLLGDRLSFYEAALPRDGGGLLSLAGDVYFDGRLDLRAGVKGYPINAIPGVADSPVAIEGMVGGKLRLGGNTTRLKPRGRIEVSKLAVRNTPLGNARVLFQPGANGADILVSGAIPKQRISWRGTAPASLDRLRLEIDAKRLALEKLIPELARAGDITGRATGKVALDITKAGLRRADIDLSQLALTMRYRPPGRRTARVLRLENQKAISLLWSDKRLTVKRAMLESSLAEHSDKRARLTVVGHLSKDASKLAARGKVPLELAEFFLARRVQRIAGTAEADVTLSGSLAQPDLKGKMRLRAVSVKMPKFDRPLQIPSARLSLRPGKINIDELIFRVDRDSMRARGHVDLERSLVVKPKRYNLGLNGKVNARLLRLFFPRQLSLATGSANINLKVVGPASDPRMLGRLKVGRVEVTPRGLGRTLTLTSGGLAFDNHKIRTTSALVGTYDEGSLKLSGAARVNEGDLADLLVRATLRNIPVRKPKVYQGEINADVTLAGDSQGLRLSGEVDLVDGRYTREFDILRDLVVRPRTYEESKPFWEGVPLWEGMVLALTLRSTGDLKVKNRYADLGFQAAMNISGTLGEPRVDGNVRVEEGNFRIPFLRGKYTVQSGEVVFSRSRPINDAGLNMNASTEYLARNGTNYQIRLQLLGSLSRIELKLTSQPSLQKGQILALLATGRTINDLRSDFNTAGRQGEAAGSAVDASVKELTGQILGSLLEDPIKQATGLDLRRLEVGTESVLAQLCRKFGSKVELCGEGEQNLLGGFRGDLSLSGIMHDYLRAVGKFQKLSTRIEREQDNPTRLRLELKFRFPLR